MSRGDRLGIAGLILACIGIGITILWPTARWIGWVAIAVAVGLIVAWGILEIRRPRQLPSFVFVFGVPLGDNNSPVWIMMLKHYGPSPACNCDVQFYDSDRKNIEHQWLRQHPNSPFLPPRIVGKSQESFHIQEAGPQGSILNFQWETLDPDHQHYTVSISCRDGVFVENWEVARVDGILRTSIRVEHGPEWVRANPKSDPLVFACADKEFLSSPLASAIPTVRPQPVHPGWKPNYRFEFPVAIIDPNNNLQVMSSPKADCGCWNILANPHGGGRCQD